MRLSSRTALAAAAVACATALAACGTGTSGAADDDEISVVASTNVWGSIAQAVAGDRVEVRSLITEPNADPHSYEASPLDAAAISDASLVVYNGGGYDHFVDDILDATGDRPAVVEAFALFESGAYSDLHAGHDHGDEDGSDDAAESTSETTASEDHSHDSGEASDADVAGDGHSHEGHDHGGINEHVWYDLATADAVAHAVAEQLTGLDPDGAAVYEANAAAFHENLHYVADVVDTLADTHRDAPVAQTETIGHYLVAAAMLDDVTPPDFTNAIENGTDPSPASIAATRQLLVDKQVRVLIYNPQTEDRISREMRTAAESSGIPVVEVFETLPEGVDYIQWQARTAETLAAALETAS
ncbi:MULTISPECIES: metal ABC transporter solute-binding protein, Zn/Mn family [Rhodococcus]|uniref:metal ABC transporter solute-binding protein, Zn/Mn family n=1 Tax=Rhodococcus TaxID=1827 RepID=UPI000D04E6AB|nr:MULTISPECIES: zinc ABC transporter substrate-binding protein [Rhodococcus]AYA24949.1 ABC transporter permease [Rhodococcus rhodochrous]MCD2097981.1 zinc ABC transporter substrate-binding protein [Rhodococcus rhodochrous]MCD2122107.1 zinc ABC transporter substrate-binding protein [Rhodococcus rhodochrous]MCQ4133952.1 zinc ABC transporter substrate-binding protein [Rhodococcus rhodochrous]MDJ0018971.1 zinc ABC transporter substrate-binding protein [Rhodococcus rhodochrous]